MANDLTWSFDTLSTHRVDSFPVATLDRSESVPVDMSDVPLVRDDVRVRRFESAQTDRLNAAHWEYANNQHINVDMITDLPTLWARCVYEASNNPLIEGVIETHITDSIGENGPSCQIEPRLAGEDSTEWEKYTTEAEDLIDQMNEAGWDLHGELPLTDLLALWMWSEWTLGDVLGQEVSVNVRGLPSVRINPIDPRRLQSPFIGATPSITAGVERDRTGGRLRYWFTDPQDHIAWFNPQPTPIDARWIYHEYRRREIGQVRGIPILSGCLQVLADLRDLDIQTLDAVRAAADHCAVAYTESPEAGFVETNQSVPFKRRRITHMPPGWKVTQLSPAHPGPQYIDFRRERLRELGRAVAMPLMTILLDASEHNYSSARMDGQNYQRALRRWQNRIERKVLNRFIYTALQEAETIGLIRPRPGRIRACWLWDPVPHVDPAKEANADETLMANYQLDPYTAASKSNRDFEQIARRWARANKMLATLALPPVGAAVSRPPAAPSINLQQGQ